MKAVPERLLKGSTVVGPLHAGVLLEEEKVSAVGGLRKRPITMEKSDFFRLDGPLAPMPARGQMRMANLSGFSRLVRGRGADPRALLQRFDIDPLLADDPDHYIESRSYVDLLEHCSTVFNDSLFGLHLAKFQEPDVYGCVTHLCRAAPTVREAIKLFIEYLPVTHAPTCSQELVVGRDIAELRWYKCTDVSLNKQANYQAALLNVKLLCQLGGRHFHPSFVSLATDTRSRDFQALQERLGCRFHTNNADNIVAFPAECLDWPVTTANRLLFKLLGGYLGRVKASQRISLPERVQDYIRGSLHSGYCSVEHCARKMGMSVRTLQARLSEFNLHFSDILEQQRVGLAEIYLQQSHMSLDDVTVNLGYSEQSTFGRAFKRWTGMTPKQYRRECRSAGEASFC